MIDYYEILQLSPEASGEKVAEQYQFLADSLQPDAFPDGIDDEHSTRTEEELRLLGEAYETLHDSTRRRVYDRDRNAAIAAAKQSLNPPPEELPPLQLLPSAPFPDAPSVVVRSPQWRSALDVRLVAAFITGILIAGGVLAGRYWFMGAQGQQSLVTRLLNTAQHMEPAGELATTQSPDTPPAATRSAVPGRGAHPFSSQIADRGTARAKSARPPRETDAADGQIGVERRDKPVSADIVLAKGRQTFGAQQIGNVEVFYPDGFQDCWTTKGNCGQPHVAADGTVGWIVYQASKSANYDFQPNGTLVLRGRGRSIHKISGTYDYIDRWGFLDRGSKAILYARRDAGGAVIELYESATGRLLDSVDGSRASLPAWASAPLDQ